MAEEEDSEIRRLGHSGINHSAWAHLGEVAIIMVGGSANLVVLLEILVLGGSKLTCLKGL